MKWDKVKLVAKTNFHWEAKKPKPIILVKIFSDNILMFFSQTLLRISLLPPSGHPSISMLFLLHSCTMKYHWGYIPTTWYFKEKQDFSDPWKVMHSIEIFTWLHLQGKLFHWKTEPGISYITFLLALFSIIKISHYHGRKQSQTTGHERWKLSKTPLITIPEVANVA